MGERINYFNPLLRNVVKRSDTLLKVLQQMLQDF